RIDRIRLGDLVWRTDDPETAKAARPFTGAAAPLHKQKVEVRAKARENHPLVTEWTLTGQPSISVTVTSEPVLGVARNHGLSPDLLREQLGRLGNTPYELAGVVLDVEGAPFAPVSLLNQVRRQAVQQLMEAQAGPRAAAVRDPSAALAVLRAEA